MSESWINEDITKLITSWKYSEAIMLYEKILKDTPEHIWAREWLGRLYLNLWEIEKAKQYLWDKLNTSKADLDIMIDFADFQKKWNEWLITKEEVVKKSEELLSTNPWHMGLREWLWRLYLNLWEAKKAKQYLWSSENSLSDTDIMKKMEVIKWMISLWENKEKVINKYKELLELFPSHLWIKEWYDLYLKENS